MEKKQEKIKLEDEFLERVSGGASGNLIQCFWCSNFIDSYYLYGGDGSCPKCGSQLGVK